MIGRVNIPGLAMRRLVEAFSCAAFVVVVSTAPMADFLSTAPMADFLSTAPMADFLSATAMADEPDKPPLLRQPESTRQVAADGPTWVNEATWPLGRPRLIGTTVFEGRPVVAGFRQSAPQASRIQSAEDIVVHPDQSGPEAEKGTRFNLPERPGGCFAQIKPGPFFGAEDSLLPRGEAGRGLLGFGRRPRPRHRGIGRPLVRESWRYRPFGASSFIGMIQGSPLIDDWVGQKEGYFGGYRLGWDFDYYWGCEIRYGFGSVPLYDSQRAKDAAEQEHGSAWNDMYDRRRDCEIVLGDIDLLYYPLGDAAWRPYLMVGLGAAGIKFQDRLANYVDKTVFATPVAIGLKYRWNDWLVLRFDCADNIIFGDGHGFNMLHDLSFTGGVEFRFGGTRTAYWPWNPGLHYW